MLELQNYGVVEMSSQEQIEVEGGILWFLVGIGVLMILHGFLDFP